MEQPTHRFYFKLNCNGKMYIKNWTYEVYVDLFHHDNYVETRLNVINGRKKSTKNKHFEEVTLWYSKLYQFHEELCYRDHKMCKGAQYGWGKERVKGSPDAIH